MNLALDHFFILTDKPKETGDLLVSMGLSESFSRDHKGQGTSNRRFEFSNGMLEILYIRDSKEANHGPAKNMRLAERAEKDAASPFGIILSRTDDSDLGQPFKGWEYQPDYFKPPMAFLVGDNAEILQEPLCIYAPFISPSINPSISPDSKKLETEKFKSISHVRLSVPRKAMSETLHTVQSADGLHIELGNEHLITVTLDNGNAKLSRDFRPNLPLIIKW